MISVNRSNKLTTVQIVWRFIGKLFVKHHNRLQFFGYEVANILLVVHETARSGVTAYGFNLETYTALFFLAGSACIWRFDPQKRPQLLCYGGMLLTIGGGVLIGAGYGLTGWSVVFASLESARGGLLIWQTQMSSARIGVKQFGPRQLKVAQHLLGCYVLLVMALSARFKKLGYFINQRPFLVGTLIKAPFRLEFIIKKLLRGDWIGVLVGLSWMLLGDVGLAFNDGELKAQVTERVR